MMKGNKLIARRVPNYLAGIGHVGREQILSDLSLNENRLGPSEQAIKAFKDAGSEIWKYPDGSHLLLKKAIAKRFGISPNRIACGAGADELITLLMRLFVGNGSEAEIVFPEFSFMMFSINALQIGVQAVLARTNNFTPSVDSIKECITNRTRAIFIANPNNPTGKYLLRNDIHNLLSQIPNQIPLVLDGAYSEYVGNSKYSDGMDILDEFPNLIVLRSFSKIFGLASLRIGWCCGSEEVIDGLNRIRAPYNVSGPAQASACAALQDDDHIKMSFIHNQRWRDHIMSVLTHLGLGFETSGGNFIMTKFQNSEMANRAYHHLRIKGVLTRLLNDYNLPNCLRITIGNDSDNKLLLQSLEEFVLLRDHIT